MSHFEFAWDARYRIVGAAFGVRPSNAWVEVDETELRVRYGVWRLRTALTNISSTELSGDFAFLKTAGPPHLSLVDSGISFATNGRSGVCVQLHRPVRGIEPTGRILHPGVTLTVADPTALKSMLEADV